eukprot:TRINITY_DN6221_c0_g1_i2.p1 TRINITY_DN6221_c0_g1~~TRINITY_DN6221_c0_g1_i2.p1  ORF type:complete len:379 (+),score=95.75 TRINITY_DN6221_c0_g1_i2:1987-3123(+)
MIFRWTALQLSNPSAAMSRAQMVRQLLGTRLPIIQGPMAGVTDPQLVAACSNAGVLGSHGVAGLSPERIAADVAEIRRLAPGKPFCINFFVLPTVTQVTEQQLRDAQRQMAPVLARVGLAEDGPLPARLMYDYDEQLAAVEQAAPPVVSSTFGALTEQQVARFKDRGCVVVGTATTVDEAVHLRRTGVDAVVAQGMEAGGHRGTFLSKRADFGDSLIGTMALVPQVVDAVPDVPVIAAGGITDGRGVAAALALGAGGVQMGTAFLRCTEASTPEQYKDILAQAHRNSDTVLTRGISGRWARGLRNRLTESLADDAALPYPAHNALTGALRAKAKANGDAEHMSLWAGQAASLARAESAADVVSRIAAELEAASAAARL